MDVSPDVSLEINALCLTRITQSRTERVQTGDARNEGMGRRLAETGGWKIHVSSMKIHASFDVDGLMKWILNSST